MSAPDQDRTDPETPASPTVSTAPAGSGNATSDVAPGSRWWSSVPRHLGRARTSTVVLGVLFVAVFALWLNVRPPADGTPRTPSDPADVEAPVVPGLPEEPEPAPTEAPEPTPAAPRPTTSAPAPEETEPTGTATPTTTAEPTTGTTTPGATTPSAPVDSPTDEPAPSTPIG